MEGRLRDLLLDIEDRIHQGTLGTLKVHTAAGEEQALQVTSHTHLSLGLCSGDGQKGVALSAGSRTLRDAVF